MLSRPASAAEAAALMRLGGRAVGGGTVVLPTVGADEHLVLLRGVPELREIERDGNVWVIGAAATLAEVRARVPAATALGDALAWIATPAVRNLATIGGNLGRDAPADLLAVLHACGAAVEVIAGAARLRQLELPTALAAEGLIVRIRIPDGASAALRLAHRDPTAPSLLVAAAGSGGTHVAIGRRLVAPGEIEDPYLAHAASVLARRATIRAGAR